MVASRPSSSDKLVPVVQSMEGTNWLVQIRNGVSEECHDESRIPVHILDATIAPSRPLSICPTSTRPPVHARRVCDAAHCLDLRYFLQWEGLRGSLRGSLPQWRSIAHFPQTVTSSIALACPFSDPPAPDGILFAAFPPAESRVPSSTLHVHHPIPHLVTVWHFLIFLRT